MEIRVNRGFKDVWTEQIKSLFYDKNRMSDFYFNNVSYSYYDELIDIIEIDIGFKKRTKLPLSKYSWIIRQCNIQGIKDYLHLVEMITIQFRDIFWHVYFIESKNYYDILHIQYSNKETDNEKVSVWN